MLVFWSLNTHLQSIILAFSDLSTEELLFKGEDSNSLTSEVGMALGVLIGDPQYNLISSI